MQHILEELDGFTGDLIVCPLCENILNVIEDLRLEWYEQDQLSTVTNFKVRSDKDGEEESTK